MSRSSRVPYHQNVYDLLQVAKVEAVPEAEAAISEWEHRTRRTFPAAMREFYTTSVILRCGNEPPTEWRLLPHELWSEYSNAERARPIPEVFETFSPRPYRRTPPLPVPGFELIWENQGNWVMCARGAGSDDPVVDVSDPCFLSPEELWTDDQSWHPIGTFSEVLSSWFAVYYVEDFVPLSFGHHSYSTGFRPADAPPKPYHNGLWLRTPADPFEPAAIDYLTEAFDEPERTPRPGNVTTYTFRPPGGIVRVTADEPGLGGALAAWWVHADTPERLTELGRLIAPFGTLRDTLRADTEPARAVLSALRGTAVK
jgi:hypothetical protein